MPRAKNAKAEVARKLYEQGILLKDIAEQLDVPEGTVRSWKKRYDWDNATLQKNLHGRKRFNRLLQLILLPCLKTRT